MDDMDVPAVLQGAVGNGEKAVTSKAEIKTEEQCEKVHSGHPLKAEPLRRNVTSGGLPSSSGKAQSRKRVSVKEEVEVVPGVLQGTSGDTSAEDIEVACEIEMSEEDKNTPSLAGHPLEAQSLRMNATSEKGQPVESFSVKEKQKIQLIAEHPLGSQALWKNGAVRNLPSSTANGKTVEMHIEEMDKDSDRWLYDHTKFAFDLLTIEENFELFKCFKKTSTYRLSLVVYSLECSHLEEVAKNSERMTIAQTIGKDVFKKIRKGGDLHRNILVAVEQLVANNPEFYKEHPYNRDALTIWLSMEAATKEKETLPDWLQIILTNHRTSLDGVVETIGLNLGRKADDSGLEWSYRLAKYAPAKTSLLNLCIYLNPKGFDLALEVLSPTEIHDYSTGMRLAYRSDFSATLGDLLALGKDDMVIDFSEEVDIAIYSLSCLNPRFYTSALSDPVKSEIAISNIELLKQTTDISAAHAFFKLNIWDGVRAKRCRILVKNVKKLILDFKSVEDVHWWGKDGMLKETMDKCRKLIELMSVNAEILLIMDKARSRWVKRHLKLNFFTTLRTIEKHVLYDASSKSWKEIVKYKKADNLCFELYKISSEDQAGIEIGQGYDYDDYFESAIKFEIENKEIFPEESWSRSLGLPDDRICEDTESNSHQPGEPSSSHVNCEEDIKPDLLKLTEASTSSNPLPWVAGRLNPSMKPTSSGAVPVDPISSSLSGAAQTSLNRKKRAGEQVWPSDVEQKAMRSKPLSPSVMLPDSSDRQPSNPTAGIASLIAPLISPFNSTGRSHTQCCSDQCPRRWCSASKTFYCVYHNV